MSPSPRVRTRQLHRPPRPLQPRSNRLPRSDSVVIAVRSILLGVAAVSVIATSNYFAYLIGRKQVTYEELRRQVDRVVQLMDKKAVEDESAPTALKQRQERFGQDAPGLTGLTTSTINGKTTVVAPEGVPAEKPTPAALIDATPVTPPDHEVRLQPPQSQNAMAKYRDTHGMAQQRSPRRQKAPKRGPAEPAAAEQSGQATRDVGLAGQ